MKTKVKVVVMVLTEGGKHLLNEIKGLKVGTIVEGTYESSNGALDFKWNGQDAVLWVGKNAALVYNEQYINLKEKHPDRVFLFREGNIYSSIYQDAVEVSKTVGITLKRDKDNVYMCGFPFYSLDIYLPKLVRAGYSISIVEPCSHPTGNKKEVVETIKSR